MNRVVSLPVSVCLPVNYNGSYPAIKTLLIALLSKLAWNRPTDHNPVFGQY